jgi:hypothetical protein
MLLIGWHFRLEFFGAKKACQTNVFTLAGTDNVKKAHIFPNIFTLQHLPRGSQKPLVILSEKISKSAIIETCRDMACTVLNFVGVNYTVSRKLLRQ